MLIFIQMSWIPLSFTNLIVDSVLAGEKVLKSFDGNLKFLYMIFLALTFIYSFWLLYISYSQSNNVNFKHQIKYILFGGITFLVLTFISSLIFPIFGVELRSLRPTAMMIFVGSTFYAVTQHRFLRLNIAIGSVLSFMLLSTIPLGTFPWFMRLIQDCGEAFIHYRRYFQVLAKRYYLYLFFKNYRLHLEICLTEILIMII